MQSLALGNTNSKSKRMLDGQVTRLGFRDSLLKAHDPSLGSYISRRLNGKISPFSNFPFFGGQKDRFNNSDRKKETLARLHKSYKNRLTAFEMIR